MRHILESWAGEGQEHQRPNWPFACASSWKSLRVSVLSHGRRCSSVLSLEPGVWGSLRLGPPTTSDFPSLKYLRSRVQSFLWARA